MEYPDLVVRASMKKKKPQQRASKDTFENVAKRLDCDEDRARFEKKLGKIAKAPTLTKK